MSVQDAVAMYSRLAGTGPSNVSLDAVPTTNGVWSKFTSAVATTQATALADAGYLETTAIVGGVAKVFRIPAFLKDA